MNHVEWIKEVSRHIARKLNNGKLIVFVKFNYPIMKPMYLQEFHKSNIKRIKSDFT